MLVTIIAFVVVLGLLIFVHELGHFITAKRAGLLVEEFGFGFPPRLFSITRGETRYSLNWIPFGGFVKILGEGGEDEQNPRSFAKQRIGVRARVVVAGVVMNFLLAFVLLSISNALGVVTPIADTQDAPRGIQVADPVVTITTVDADGPAQTAGLRPGDELLSVVGVLVTTEDEVIAQIDAQRGQSTELVVQRGGEQLTLSLTPRADPPDGQGPLGISLIRTATVRYVWYQAIWIGAKETVLTTGRIVQVFWQMLVRLLTTGNIDADVAGPIGIAVLTGQVLDLGVVPLLQFTALLSINLGIINVLPFPALDGGRLLFLAIEKFRRRKVSKRVENAVHSIGFGLLLLLIVVVTFRDFLRFNIVQSIQNLF